MDSGRRTIVISTTISVVALALLVWMLREDARRPRVTTPSESAPAAAAPAVAVEAGTIVAAPVVVPAASPSLVAAAPSGSLNPEDWLGRSGEGEGVNAPISPEPPKREGKLTLAQEIEGRKNGLKMIDEMLGKVEKDKAAAEKSGDTNAAKIASQRLERMKKVRVLREKELAILEASDGGIADGGP